MRHPALLLLLLSCTFAAPAAAQQQLTAEDYARAERFLAPNVVPLVTGLAGTPAWLDSGRFWYRTTTQDGTAFVHIDPEQGTRTDAFDTPRLAAALSAVMGGQVALDRVPFQWMELSKDGRSITFRIQGSTYTCDLQRYMCVQAEQTGGAQAPPNSRTSPDGRWAAFIRDYNLWVQELATGREIQLTNDGEEDFGYATDNAGWTHSDRPILTWSPDSRSIATFQHDGRGVGDMVLASTTVGRPEKMEWAYPVPGDSVVFRVHRVVINGIGEGTPKVVRLQMEPDAHRSTVSDHIACSGGSVCDLQWYDDGSHIAFISSSRDHQDAWLRVANTTTGEVRTVLHEQSGTQIGDASLSENLWKVLPGTNEVIWWSQRDNWLHLYLYDLNTGQLKNRITTGSGNVTDILRIDEDGRSIWFMAQGRDPQRDPYFRHLYRIGFDGSNEQLLTPENANHDVALSADGAWIVDTYSTPDTPPVTVLRDGNGNMVQELERADVSRLLATGWKPPTPVRMKGRDGTTDIYGLMYTPTTLDSTAKYPIVNRIYPGPQAGSVGSRSFSPARGDNQALAELGFVVVEIDGMGTPGRSKAFHDTYYGDMGDNTLPDQITGMRQLAERYPFIDIERVGMWGHSGGGFATAAALLRYPDFFDVGVSQSGNHDNRNYEDDWGERYQGLLVQQGASDNYADEANQTHAANLRGKLLLAHGGMDDNVPPYNTYLVVDALIKANKDFDLLIFPNARHGYGVDNNYMMRRRWDYFVRHLLGAEPPHEYRIGGR